MNTKQCWVLFPSLALLVGAASFTIFRQLGNSPLPPEPESAAPEPPAAVSQSSAQESPPPAPQPQAGRVFARGNLRGRGTARNPAPPAPAIDLTATPPLELERQAKEAAAAAPAKESSLSADFECALAPNVKKISDTHFVLDMENKYEYMFLFKLSGVAGKTVRIDCRNIPLDKWRTLNPVYRYANDGLPELPPLLPDGYKLSDAQTTRARNGPLLPDTTGQPWQFIPEVWATGGAALSFVQTFDKDDVTVAMKTPFTLEDEKLLCAEAEKCPDAKVIDIGRTPEGRTLHVIKVSTGGEEGEKTHPCILMYAREHADEHDSSWALAGALRHVLKPDGSSQDLRNRLTFILIPVLDPDAAAKCTHESVIATFNYVDVTPESRSFAMFFQDWMKKGKPIDLVLNLHNLESSEGAHLVAADIPPGNTPQNSAAISLHSLLKGELERSGIRVAVSPLHLRLYEGRLGGWLSTMCGASHLLYENNSQQPDRHLSVAELGAMGDKMLITATHFLASAEGEKFTSAVASSKSAYVLRWQQHGSGISELNPFSAEETCLAAQHVDELLSALSETKKEN